jgi:hypothetical protein
LASRDTIEEEIQLANVRCCTSSTAYQAPGAAEGAANFCFVTLEKKIEESPGRGASPEWRVTRRFLNSGMAEVLAWIAGSTNDSERRSFCFSVGR